MDFKTRARGASDLKLSRWLDGARKALAGHERDEPVFRDVRDWVRERRQAERRALVGAVEVLEAEYARRKALQPQLVTS